MRTTPALEVGVLGRMTDDRHPFLTLQGQNAIILQQHHPLRRHLACQGMMGGAIESFAFGRLRTLEDNPQDAAGRLVQ